MTSPVCALSRAVALSILSERGRRGWTQRDLAIKAGVSVSTVGLIEIGFRNVTLPVLEAIAEAFGMEPAELLRGDRESATTGTRG